MASGQKCVQCHQEATPRIVQDWKQSKHSLEINAVSCSVCHGDAHSTKDDVHQAQAVTSKKCMTCHEKQWGQFSQGKHSKAWKAMQAMPTFHWQPMALTTGMKGCGGCHKIGFKSQEEIAELKEQSGGFGLASCDACHTRHTFSVREARQPQACRTCHSGFDHPQWEMYSGSKHGVRHKLKQLGILEAEVAAPTCQKCHMHNGHHAVRTAWGFLGLRLPLPQDDPEWARDRTLIIQALGLMTPDGEPTPRLGKIKELDFLRTSRQAFEKERADMLQVCSECHSENFARAELTKGDDMIRQADAIMAEAIQLVAELYAQGHLPRESDSEKSFPDILAFHDVSTSIEQELFLMFQEYRMRTFQGTFHANPDYALWYGWSRMQQSLTRMREMAEQLKR